MKRTYTLILTLFLTQAAIPLFGMSTSSQKTPTEGQLFRDKYDQALYNLRVFKRTFANCNDNYALLFAECDDVDSDIDQMSSALKFLRRYEISTPIAQQKQVWSDYERLSETLSYKAMHLDDPRPTSLYESSMINTRRSSRSNPEEQLQPWMTPTAHEYENDDTEVAYFLARPTTEITRKRSRSTTL